MKVALLVLLALELAVCGCGNSNDSTSGGTTTTGNWEAQLTGGTEQASLLNFVTSFSVTNSGPLDITGISFLNTGACFANGVNGATVSGNADFTTSSTNAVTGTMSLTITSTTSGSVLTMTGDLTGTSDATSTTTGTLSNGVVVGSWSLTPGSGAADCNTGSGSFTMCQNKATCSTT